MRQTAMLHLALSRSRARAHTQAHTARAAHLAVVDLLALPLDAQLLLHLPLLRRAGRFVSDQEAERGWHRQDKELL